MPNALADTFIPTASSGTPDPDIVFSIAEYGADDPADRTDRNVYGNYYEILQHELGHLVGFRHTNESPSSGTYTPIYGSYNGTAQTTNVMHSQPIVPVQPADAEALRLLYPTHDNDYDASLDQITNLSSTTARVGISWNSRSATLPDHTKVMYTITKTKGRRPFNSESGFRGNTRMANFVLPRDNVYTICIAGANFREDETFPGRCISVNTRDFEEPTGLPQPERQFRG